jgi:probable HAF family extracellular repeat protein
MSRGVGASDDFRRVASAHSRRLPRVFATIAVVALLSPVSLAWQYVAVDLGSLGGFSVAESVNSRGQITGRSATVFGVTRAFLWEGGVMLDLGTLPGGTRSEAYAINERGQVVGRSTFAEETCSVPDGCWRAFLYENGSMTDMGVLPGHSQSAAFAINNRGQVVGISGGVSSTAHHPVFVWHAVLWDKGDIRDLGSVPGALFTYAFGISESGQVVGWWGDGATVSPVAWTRGTVVTLPSPPGASFTAAYKVNSRGQAVGYAGDRDYSRAVMWWKGEVADLGALHGATSNYARDVNNRGQIVGLSADRAFLWVKGHITELGPLPGGTQSFASAINEAGDVVGASYDGQTFRAVLWTRGD